jgi:hypothetical protein
MGGDVSLIDGHIDEVRICPICGKAFVPHQWQQKYCCSDCAKKAKKLKDIEHHKSYRMLGKRPKEEPLFEATVKVKSKPLNSMSGEELLSYGSVQQGMNAEELRVHIPNMEKEKAR